MEEKINNCLGLLNVFISHFFLKSYFILKKKTREMGFNMIKKKLFSYFYLCQSYASPFQHRVMIGDEKRTGLFRRAIMSSNLREKIVLDAGCGLGIMSFFAVQAGAKKVFAVDCSDYIYHAKRISQMNNFDKKIQFVQQDLSRVYLEKKVDVLIHETIGNFLFNEDTVKVVSRLRKRILIKNGQIIPYQVDWYFVPVSMKTFGIYPPQSFWQTKPYGFDFSILTKEEIDSPQTILLNSSQSYLARPQCLFKLNYYTIETAPKSIEGQFKIDKQGNLNGLVSFFKIKLNKGHILNTAPGSRLTHWGQGFFPIKKAVSVKKNNNLRFILEIKGVDYHQWRCQIDYLKLK